MPPVSIPAIPSAIPTDHSDPHPHPHPPSRQAFSEIFWPVLFGVLFIALLWWFWVMKAGFRTSDGPNPSPKPAVSQVVQMSRARGTPLLGHPSPTLPSTMPSLPPPPPAYIYPPRYDDVQGPHGKAAHPS